MHEVDNFSKFAKNVFNGLIEAVKVDVDIFLMATSAILWPIKIFRGLAISFLFYITCRRLDGLMTGYLLIKKNETSNVS